MALHAYLDSGTQGGKLTVAAVSFGLECAAKANRHWLDLWGDTICHMSDLHAKRKAFKGWSEERASQMLTDSIAIINRFSPISVAITLNVDEYAAMAPTTAIDEWKEFLDLGRTPYAFCSHVAMMTLAQLAGGDNARRDIFYFVESGDDGQGQLKQFIKFAQDRAPLRNLYRVVTHNVVHKSDARLLECSDILAWEWCRHRNRQPGDQHVRKSLAALLQTQQENIRGMQFVETRKRYAIEYGGEVLAKHMHWFRESIAGRKPPEKTDLSIRAK